MENRQPKVGDVWTWCGEHQMLVLKKTEDGWLCRDLETGRTSEWLMAVNDEVESVDWEFVS